MRFPFQRLACAAAACLAATAQAQVVQAPPLPPGSALVRLDPGMSEAERKRHVRAHHHKYQHKKDFTRDDSVHGHESQLASSGGPGQPGTGAAAAGAGQAGATGRAGAAGVVQDGSGTGPAREKTDKGASSWFYGKPETK